MVGATARAREQAIGALLAGLAPTARAAAVLEGLPDGKLNLVASTTLDLHRIAPACLCCTGNLVLRVTLNRILRLRPDCLMIGVAVPDHIDQLRSWLQDRPYDQLLVLTPDLVVS